MSQLFGHARTPEILSKVLLEVTKPLSNELAIRLEDGIKRNREKGNQTALTTYKEAETFVAVVCKVLGSGGHVSVKVITETLLSIIAGFIQFSDQFTESNDYQLKADLSTLVEENIYFDLSQNDSLFDDAFEDKLKPAVQAVAGKPDGRRIVQSLDADNLDELVGLLERYADRILDVSNNSFEPISKAIQNSCDFAKGLRVKSSVKLTTSSMKRHFGAILQKISDFRIATGLIPIDIGEYEAKNVVSGRVVSQRPGEDKAPPSSIRVGSGGDSDSYTGLFMINTAEIAHGVAKHYSLIGQEHTSAAKLFIPPALKCLQAVGRLFLCFIEFEAKTCSQLEVVLESLFQGMHFSEYLSRIGASSSTVSVANSSNANGTLVGAMLINTLLERDLQGFSELKGFLANAVDSVGKHRMVKSEATMGTGDVISMASYAELAASSLVIFGAANSTLQHLRFSAGSLLLDLCTMAPEVILKEYSGDKCANIL